MATPPCPWRNIKDTLERVLISEMKDTAQCAVCIQEGADVRLDAASERFYCDANKARVIESNSERG